MWSTTVNIQVTITPSVKNSIVNNNRVERNKIAQQISKQGAASQLKSKTLLKQVTANNEKIMNDLKNQAQLHKSLEAEKANTSATSPVILTDEDIKLLVQKDPSLASLKRLKDRGCQIDTALVDELTHLSNTEIVGNNSEENNVVELNGVIETIADIV